ncbi:unnamed protein product, partial [Darwinula stevensoni]
MALCDWSNLQKTRRNIVNSYTHPRPSSDTFRHLNDVIAAEVDRLIETLREESTGGGRIQPKQPLLQACANVFTSYLCSRRFEAEDEDFREMVKCFDLIFYDINQGYAVDFLPWLAPCYKRHFGDLEGWSKTIRAFILQYIVGEHEAEAVPGEPRDFVDVLLDHLRNEGDIDWQSALFELEDLIGGHSAIGNLWMRIVAQMVQNPDVMAALQEEIEAVTGGKRPVTLDDRPDMPYTEAVMLEALRIISSPIVPHVATADTTIQGFAVEEGTVIFLNNYELNTSPLYWNDPWKFNPGRFVQNGQIVKPDFFIPFSTGKRACMGYRLVQSLTFMLVAR